MFCPKCGKQQPEDAPFCDACGADLQADAPEVEQDGSSSAAQPAEEVIRKAERAGRTTRRVIVVSVVAVVVVVALAIAAFFLTQPPALSDDEILSEFDAEGIAANIVVGSDWGHSGGFSMVSKTVDSIEDQSQQQSPSYKVAHVTIVCENATFRATSSYELVYRLEERAWVQDDALQLSQAIEPIGGVDDAKLVEQAPTFIKMVDDQHVMKDANGKKQYLKDRYDENVSFEVVENTTSASGGSAKLAMSAQKGFATYKGTLTISFAWNGGDWEVSDCTADEAAYKADFSSLVGSWSGTRHDGNAAVGQDCMAGRTIPFKLTVKNVDAESMVMNIDMEFVGHKHEWLGNIVESSEGDETVSLIDTLISVPADIGDRNLVYEMEKNDYPRWDCKVFLTANENQTLEVMATSSWDYNTHYDFYTLEKA